MAFERFVRCGVLLVGLLFVVRSARAAETIIPGDVAAGEKLFQSEKCTTCHSLHGVGGTAAPDLAVRRARYTPAGMVSLMWDHAPAMFGAMQKASFPIPSLTTEKAADLFAFFYSVNYFERPGDVGRGRKVFVDKGCAGCHNLSADAKGVGPSVATWDATTNPIELARQMWNHSSRMTAEMAKKKVKWPELSGQDMTDLMVYLRGLPQARERKVTFSPASASTGETLFQVKGCANCHKGAQALPSTPQDKTMADFAASMWDHAPLMKQRPQLNSDEMRRIVGYVWSRQFFNEGGDAARGAKLFQSKNCVRCHGPSATGEMNLRARAGQFSAFVMTSALWQHGPRMLEQTQKQNVPWPTFQNNEMADLIAFLNTKP